MKLLIDEMWSHAAAQQLRERGHDVRSALDDELRSTSDADLMAIAIAEERVLVTDNASDFRELVESVLSGATLTPA